MSIGCPVVVADRASLPEVCGTAALYAAPDEPQTWLAKLKELKRNPELRRTMMRRGHKESKRFSWEESARRYLELFADIDGVRPIGNELHPAQVLSQRQAAYADA
jgi:glycosyltransferase involved in cell wall biosynthesis